MVLHNHIGVVIVVAIFSVVVYDIFYKVEENRCGMTWMYERPEFMKLTMPASVQREFSKYYLFIYGEGRYAAYLKNMQGNYKLDGIPVLFVHGNAGSYKQVRSLGSVSLRKSESAAHHFNYFTVDFKEELSALYGPFLNRQTNFLQHAISQIFSCYSHLPVSLKPTSIIAVGHSMGGIVIRGLYTLPTFDASLINTIVNLATPQQEPPLILDKNIYEFYQKVNDYWKRESNRSLSNTTFLSIGGGFRDYFVRSDLCYLKTSNKEHRSILTTSIPHIWRSTDHQCIVWCNELVRALTRCFFNMIIKKTKQISTNHQRRLKVIDSIFSTANFEHDSPRNSCISVEAKNSVDVFRTNKSCFYIFSSVGRAINLWSVGSVRNWVLMCNDSSACAFPYYYTVPTDKKPFFYLSVMSSITILSLSDEEIWMQAQHENNILSFNAPFLMSKEREIYLEHGFLVEINLIGFIETWQAFRVALLVNNNRSFQVSVGLLSPFTPDVEYFLLNGSTSASLKLFKPKPYNQNDGKHVRLLVWGKDMSMIKIQIQPDFVAMLGQIFRFKYATILRVALLVSILKSIAELCLLRNFSVRHSASIVVLLTAITLIKQLFLEDIGRAGIARITWIETFSIGLSLLISEVWHFLVKKLLNMLRLIYTPLVVLCHVKVIPKKVTMLGLLITVTSLSVLTAYQSFFFGFPYLVYILIHILKIYATEDCDIQRLHASIFAGILPTILVFLTVPTIVYFKDWVENTYSLEPVPADIYCLQVTYALYLLVDLRLPKIRMSSSYIFFAIVVSLGVVSETLHPYNQTYIATFYLIYLFCAYFPTSLNKLIR